MRACYCVIGPDRRGVPKVADRVKAGRCRVFRLLFFLAMAGGCLGVLGCGRGEFRPKIVYGTVMVGDQKVETGQVRFVPIDATAGAPPGASPIVVGQYRIDARGGVPLGRYRVEVDAYKKTGRQVRGFTGTEQGMIDELVHMGPEKYGGPDSPLIVELTADSDGRIDIQIPNETEKQTP